MNPSKRTTLMSGTALAAALWLLNGCSGTSTVAEAENGSTASHTTSSSHSVSSGTTINVALDSQISSKTATAGDAWHGHVSDNVTTQNGGMIPAGSAVEGVVASVVAPERGSRAMLELAVRSIHVNGHDERIAATSEPVIAGSPRARNLGAIAGGAAAGALIGKAVGDGKNAAVGGLIGGATAAGVVATSKGYQVVLKDGTVMSFTVSQTVAMR